jgi:hypothetical protein
MKPFINIKKRIKALFFDRNANPRLAGLTCTASYNINYPLDQFDMMPFIFGDPVEVAPYHLVLYITVLRYLDVEITSVLLNHLHHLELADELLLAEVFHLSGPV